MLYNIYRFSVAKICLNLTGVSCLAKVAWLWIICVRFTVRVVFYDEANSNCSLGMGLLG